MIKSAGLLFKITDLLAWGMIAITAVSVVAAPFIAPGYYELKGVPVDWAEVAAEAALNLSLVIGLFLYIKRKIIGFLFIAIAFVGYALLTGNTANYWILLALLSFIGLPWFLSRSECKQTVENGQSSEG